MLKLCCFGGVWSRQQGVEQTDQSLCWTEGDESLKSHTRGSLASRSWSQLVSVIPWVWALAWCLLWALVRGQEGKEAEAASRMKLVGIDQKET